MLMKLPLLFCAFVGTCNSISYTSHLNVCTLTSCPISRSKLQSSIQINYPYSSNSWHGWFMWNK